MISYFQAMGIVPQSSLWYEQCVALEPHGTVMINKLK